MKYLNKLALALLALVSSGCYTPESVLADYDKKLNMGVISENISPISQVKTIAMTPVFAGGDLPNDPDARFGLYWDNNKKEKAILEVEIRRAANFSPSQPFEFQTDGKSFHLNPVNKSDYGTTDTDTYGLYSSKSYWIPKEHILRIANAEKTFYKFYYLKNTYAEGEISYQYPTYQSFVPSSFNEFYQRAWSN